MDGWRQPGGSKSRSEEIMSIVGRLREAVAAGRGVGHDSNSEPDLQLKG